MSVEQLTSILLSSVLITFGILAQAYWWQRKEYRIDRMRAHLLTPTGRDIQRDWLLWLFVACVAFGWIAMYSSTSVATALAWVALIVLLVRQIKTVVRRGIFRPDSTLKGSLVVIGGMVAMLAVLFALVTTGELLVLRLVTAILLVPIVMVIVVGVVNGIGRLRQQSMIAQAAVQRSTYPKLTVIGVTGSVGKTSTKEYLAHLLRQTGKKVAATAEHRNSEFTVAQDMLKQLSSQVEMYVVEAAAYRQGEVAAIAQLSKPTVGVITAITNQHESLFGSLEAIAKAKWELVDGLPKDGIAVLNADDPQLAKRIASAPVRVITFSVQKPADVYVENIRLESNKTRCQLHIDREQHDVELPVIGRGALVSVVAAAAAAHAVGVDAQTLFTGVQSVPTLARTMQIRTGKRGAAVLDDSYSASEASVINALDHLQRFSQPDKRVVLVPIIELSSSGPAVHERIGQELARSHAHVYIYGRAYEKDIRKGAGTTDSIQWFDDVSDLLAAAEQGLTTASVVLLEGRVPDSIRRSL